MAPTRPCPPSRAAIAACGLAVLVACRTSGGGSSPPATIAVSPICSIHATIFADDPKTDSALVADRTDAATFTGLTRFRGISSPVGNTAVAPRNDVYGVREAWFRHPAAPAVFRAQAHPARRPAPFNDGDGSAWTVNVQNTTGSFSAPTVVGTANSGAERDTPESGGLPVPQLMPVGLANPEMFACVGMRSDDGAVRTTRLVQLLPPPGPPLIRPVQDLLNGDDRFVPNAPGPIVGPATPPTPTLHGVPGNPVRDGIVTCAMAQVDDDLSTRELHMIALSGGRLYHATATRWSAATTGSGSRLFRFNEVSPWGDVGNVLGMNMTDFESAAIVARPRSLHVFFFARVNGVHKLWHTVRFSATGAWRAPDDVLSLAGAATGTSTGWRIAAGECPLFGPEAAGGGLHDTELVYVMYRPDRSMSLGRVVSTPRQWSPAVSGAYSPLGDLSNLLDRASTDAARNVRLDTMSVATRPFPDNARP